MGQDDNTENVPLNEAHIVQIDLLDRDFVVVTFANGESAKIATSKIRELAIRDADEIARPVDD